ncbi:MAG: hypothetical protein U0610_22890 [bacterium]
MRKWIRDQRGGITPRTLLVIAILGGGAFSASDYVGAYWQWYKVRSAALDIARFSRNVSDEEIKADLARRLKLLGVPKYSTVTLQREPVDQSHVRLGFDYIRQIYVPPVAADWKKVISKKFKVQVEQGLPMVKGHM